MHQFNLAIAACAAVVVALGLVSGRIQRAPVSRPLLALLAGVALGPVALGLLTPEEWPDETRILREVARFALAVSVFGIALRTPAPDIRGLLRPVGLLLTLGMLAMWAVSAGLAWAVLGVSPLVALAVGAVVTPTDPVVASSIATGTAAERALPDRLRSTLSLESGANDGLGYLVVLLPVVLMGSAADPWSRWAVDVVLVGVVLAVTIGVAVGWVVARLVRAADAWAWIDRKSLLGLSVALSFLVLTLAKLAGSDGILAAFAAGIAFRLTVNYDAEYDEQEVQESIAKLLNLPVFVILGAALPWQAWTGATAAFALLVLALRRPVALLALGPFLGAGLRRRDTVFLGWFGPVGVAALYYSLLVQERTGDPAAWHAASLTIAASVLIHGLTSGPGLGVYERAGGEPAGRRGG